MVGTYLHEWRSTIVVTEICLSIVCQEKFYNVLFPLSTGKVNSRSKKQNKTFNVISMFTIWDIGEGYHSRREAIHVLLKENTVCFGLQKHDLYKNDNKKIPFYSPFANCKMQK